MQRFRFVLVALNSLLLVGSVSRVIDSDGNSRAAWLVSVCAAAGMALQVWEIRKERRRLREAG